ncbi:hypothetical protein F5146DRAFT_1132150 [Armillaria mellea]|nr:hypothetical protein F5146DRAFT_1132150 [Armillaria mellea]
MFFCTFTALLAVVTAVTSSPLAAHDASPKCTIVVTPKDLSYAARAANQLTYVETLAAPGFLYCFRQSTYPDGTSVTSISLMYGPSMTSNSDRTYTTITALTVTGLTSDQIVTIIKGQ